MSERFSKLIGRIRDELADLDSLIERVQEGWRRAQRSGDNLYLDSVAWNLHGFYAGLERLFELIASIVDGTLPRGANWHQTLLRQMASDVPRVRPAVISEGTRHALDGYRGFRHIVRHVYTLRFDPVKMQRLVREAPAVFVQVRAELLPSQTSWSKESGEANEAE